MPNPYSVRRRGGRGIAGKSVKGGYYGKEREIDLTSNLQRIVGNLACHTARVWRS